MALGRSEAPAAAMADYRYRPYCQDTPGWANGFDCLAEGKTAEDGCTDEGWTCAGYELKHFCGDGHKRTGDWAFGRSVRYPALNCCECGGSASKGGSCRDLGCGGSYDRDRPCQCNDDCAHFGNCCYDFVASCKRRRGGFLGWLLGHRVGDYRPHDVSLLDASEAPSQTFYMYRAQTAESFPPTNVNMASLGGVIWYLHNEIVNKCPRRGTVVSKSDITRVMRYKVTTKATTPLYARGMNFGVKSSYDYGASTGPGNRHGEDWARYGYFVGCNVLGEWPHVAFGSAKAYPRAYWYSLPGECPNEDIEHKDSQCRRYEPGGHCSSPTGKGDCTYSFEEAGEIDIDELVGITPKWSSHDAFCRQGCKEFIPWDDRGHCLDFWDGKWDRERNEERVRQADELFAKRYPRLPRDRDLQPPDCDFDRENFYRGHMPKPP